MTTERPAPTPDPEPAPVPSAARRGSSGGDISSSLLGRLPCLGCGYDLQGLSVLGVCPECGAAVRATILAVVDPLAEELRPINRPRLVAVGLIAWSLGGLVAALTCWVAMGIGLYYGVANLGTPPWLVTHAPEFIAAELWISGFGALLLCYPHRSVGAANVLLAVLGAAAYIPLGLVTMNLTDRSLSVSQQLGQIDMWWPMPERTMLRIGACTLILIIIAALRPNARVLVARSLVMRTGRVDRQTLLAVAAAAGMIVCGDLLGFFAPAPGGNGVGELLRMVGGVLMILGGGLLTLGLAGALVDAVRIASAVIAPSPSLRQVLHRDEEVLGGIGSQPPTGRDLPTQGGGQ